MLTAILALALTGHGHSLEEIDTAREHIRPLLDALATVESANDDDAVGDNGKAIGRYQIWEVYWHDAVEFNPALEGDYMRVKNRIYAERVLVSYLLRYAPQAVAELDYEKLARIHNGGPKGYRKKATVPYWNKVKALLVKPIGPV